MVEHPPPPLLLRNGQPLHEAARYADPDEFGDGTGLALPHVFSFAAVVGGASKTYWHERFDEAMRHSRENALAMRRDAYLMSLLQERKFAVAGLPWYLEVPDPSDKRQAAVRAALTQAVRGIRGFRRMVLAWLEAIWYGRYAVQFAWRWQRVDGRRALGVKAWAPVNGDKIGYHWDGTPWVLVNGPRAFGLPGANLVRTTRGPAVALTGGWRERFVIHQHEIDDADYFDAEAHGGRYGVGIRSRIYWLDFLKREYLDWVVTYLERVGLGTRLWKYDAGNPRSKEAAEQAAKDNSRRVNILVPVWNDGRGNYSGGVEVVEASTGGVEVLRSMMDAVDHYIERYIVGQAGSAQGQASGLGNEAQSEFMSSTKDAIRDNDANLCSETITGSEEEPGLISLLQRYTFPDTVPGRPDGFPVLLKFGLEKTLNNQRVQSIQTVVGMGLPVRKDDVYNAAGLSRPEEHDDVLEGQQQGQPGQGGPGGGNPLEALLGGGGGEEAGGEEEGEGPTPPGGAEEGAADAPASEEDVDAFLDGLFGGGGEEGGEEEEGDEPVSEEDVNGFLEGLFGEGEEEEEQPEQMARQGRHVEQYGWRDMGPSPQGGKKRVWKGTPPDKGTRHQISEPGTGRAKKQPAAPAAKKPARKATGDVEGAKAAIEQAKAGKLSREELGKALAGLTTKQLDELKRHFGVRGGGTKKADKAAALEKHATEKPARKPHQAPAKERRKYGTADQWKAPRRTNRPGASGNARDRNSGSGAGRSGGRVVLRPGDATPPGGGDRDSADRRKDGGGRSDDPSPGGQRGEPGVQTGGEYGDSGRDELAPRRETSGGGRFVGSPAEAAERTRGMTPSEVRNSAEDRGLLGKMRALSYELQKQDPALAADVDLADRMAYVAVVRQQEEEETASRKKSRQRVETLTAAQKEYVDDLRLYTINDLASDYREAKLKNRGFNLQAIVNEVASRLQTGKPVPPEVLADYPELAKQPATRQPNSKAPLTTPR